MQALLMPIRLVLATVVTIPIALLNGLRVSVPLVVIAARDVEARDTRERPVGNGRWIRGWHGVHRGRTGQGVQGDMKLAHIVL